MNHELIRADARFMPLADKSVQVIITSPPYLGLRSYEGKHQDYGQEKTIEEYVEKTIQWLREAKRVLKDDGVLFLNLGDSYAGSGMGPSEGSKQSTKKGSLYLADAKYRRLAGVKNPPSQLGKSPYTKKPGTDIPMTLKGGGKIPPGTRRKSLCLIPERVALAALKDGWIIRNIIVWKKKNPIPASVKDRLTRSYEDIIVMVKQPKYYWDHKAAQEEAAHSGKKRIALRDNRSLKSKKGYKRGQGALRGASHSDGLVKGDGKVRNMRDVWEFSVGCFKEAHYATFPLELPLRCIALASRPGDIVLDPFCGTGTAGIAAKQLDRHFIGLDLAYQDLARKRLNKCQETYSNR